MSTLLARKLISKNLTIPMLPAVVQKVQRMLKDPDAAPKDLGEVVAADVSLAAKVLKIVNSAYYGLRERCLVPQQAVSILGVRVLGNLVTQAAVIRQFEHLKAFDFDMEAEWKHSILVGQACNFLAKRSKALTGLSPDELYVCGLLHDMGKLVMLDCLKQDYLDTMRWAHKNGQPVFAAEQERLGFNHTDVGPVVCEQWGLPSQISKAIQYHHGPREQVRADPVVALVAHANLLVQRVLEGNLGAASTVIDAETARLLAVKPEDCIELVGFVGQTAATVEV